MALNYKTIEYKPILKTPEGEQYIDLMGDVFTGVELDGGDLFKVTKYYVARPDLVSFVTYGTDRYADIICKCNGLSNPFELNEGDILFLPSLEYVGECINGSRQPSQLVSDVELYNEISNRVLSSQKLKNERRSPNEQVIGDRNIVIDKSTGIVLY